MVHKEWNTKLYKKHKKMEKGQDKQTSKKKKNAKLETLQKSWAKRK